MECSLKRRLQVLPGLMGVEWLVVSDIRLSGDYCRDPGRRQKPGYRMNGQWLQALNSTDSKSHCFLYLLFLVNYCRDHFVICVSLFICV